MLGVMIKNDNIPRLGFKDNCRHIPPLQTPTLRAIPNLLIGQDIKVECDFDVHWIFRSMLAVRMPPRISNLKVPITSHVVEIFLQQRGRRSKNTLVIEQRRKHLTLINE